MNTLAQLEVKHPVIDWRKPIRVAWPDGTRFACRVCIANKGLKHSSQWQWSRYIDAARHIEEHERVQE